MKEKDAAKLLGSKGGKKTSKLHGKEHYRKMGKKSGKVRKSKTHAVVSC